MNLCFSLLLLCFVVVVSFLAASVCSSLVREDFPFFPREAKLGFLFPVVYVIVSLVDLALTLQLLLRVPLKHAKKFYLAAFVGSVERYYRWPNVWFLGR